MACINMYNPDHCAPAMSSPRISFSSDFALEPPQVSRNPGPPPDPNFEFSVGSHHMMAADQLIFKGRLLPLRDNYHHYGAGAGPHGTGRFTTLRDELRSNDDGRRPPTSKGSIKWKELLGLKNKSQSTAKKASDKGSLDQVNESHSIAKSTQESYEICRR